MCSKCKHSPILHETAYSEKVMEEEVPAFFSEVSSKEEAYRTQKRFMEGEVPAFFLKSQVKRRHTQKKVCGGRNPSFFLMSQFKRRHIQKRFMEEEVTVSF